MNKVKNIVYIGGNGFVYAIHTHDGEILWELELKKLNWFVIGSIGNGFVSLMEDGPFLYAFAHGIFYKIKKSNGKIVCMGKEIKNLKNKAGVFSVDPAASTGGSIAAGSGDGDGDGSGGDGDGGGGGD